MFTSEFYEAFRDTWLVIGVLAAVVVAGIVIVKVWPSTLRFWRREKILHEMSWGKCFGILALSFPLLVFHEVGTSVQQVLGIAAAGALVGICGAPFAGWRYRRLGVSKAFGISLLTIVGGSWGSLMLMASLVLIVT
jgi:hypothetical protein